VTVVDTPASERLIVALDVPSNDQALRLVDELEGIASFFKVGLELFVAGGIDALLKKLIGEKRIFVDLKLPNDIGETIRRAVKVYAELGVEFLTLSGEADPATIRAAREGRGDKALPRLLYVSYLSSKDEADLREGGSSDRLVDHVVDRARRAVSTGCDGLIASGNLIRTLRQEFPDSNAVPIVSPGVRPAGSASDDHKRTATPYEAIRMGADFLVVGRPIRDQGSSDARRDVAREVIAEIERGLADRARSQAPRLTVRPT
jgi:orotidine-5'-phosphate decarboxylase